eukprot:TRINITY_DN339_c0_g1_i2.p1 TRINITY_DN339_c0_g1~~TRINITY_DN339_c0_g1_i2.p1  ORF type:complete len:108 (-),score=18.88 TRINITY_DN339_c0_g1_i2:105-428(-)
MSGMYRTSFSIGSSAFRQMHASPSANMPQLRTMQALSTPLNLRENNLVSSQPQLGGLSSSRQNQFRMGAVPLLTMPTFRDLSTLWSLGQIGWGLLGLLGLLGLDDGG